MTNHNRGFFAILPLVLLAMMRQSSCCHAFSLKSPSSFDIHRRVGSQFSKSSFVTRLSPVDFFDATSQLLADATTTTASPDYIPGTSGEVSYSRASYYVILGLYLTSFPGLWSVIKRSTTAKVKRKTYVSKGEKADGGGKSLREQAGEIMAYMKANNYEVVDAGETITFRGIVQRSTSQAFFLVFCAAVGLASLALVLQIQFQNFELPGIGQPNWFLLTLLSPYAGLYYWRAGDRVDECSIKLEANDDETENSMIVQGPEEEIERMWRTMEWQEKGMVKVPGLLDSIG
ncbi:acetylhydrolase [Nitzschia inconspicua]|uniref:Acetylhydrolase n=1 Tax=Nitzschia inconspicua TaxID=303405 RepID=A0A9K3Q112_9STRA|nr:acetylhydrolase [Nitzschia inconspicua]KAG7367482.1 acetylhydrolase [Nitzschia inconspicua]